jgi:predicted nucleic acid-binding protein
MCRAIAEAATKGQFEIATATISYAEVVGRPETRIHGAEKIAQFFEVDYILLVNVDRAVGERARTLMMAGFSKLKPADACHLAAAALSNSEEMHTFDDKLLDLDGRIDKADGTKLKICKPGMANPAPLIKVMDAKIGQTELSFDPPAPPHQPQARELDLENLPSAIPTPVHAAAKLDLESGLQPEAVKGKMAADGQKGDSEPKSKGTEATATKPDAQRPIGEGSPKSQSPG